jgi:hypothetical protein
MRFCSPACGQAYQRRLNDDTKAKICRLDRAAQDRASAPTPLFRSDALAGVIRRLAG